MTANEKELINRLRERGQGYKKIAATLNLSPNAVKSYFRRHPVESENEMPENVCPMCGKRLTIVPHKKRKKFCSDKCRMKWWNAHPECVRHKTVSTWACSYCGKEFQYRGRIERKYCSRDCYFKARSKEDSQNG